MTLEQTARAPLLAALLMLAGSGCSSSTTRSAPGPFPNSISQQPFTSGGATYPCAVFTPSAWTAQAALPALLLVHGFGGRGQQMLDLWQTFADENGIVLVAPTFPLNGADPTFENLVPTLYPALMEFIRQSWRFDSRRVYVFGYSAGGYTSFDAATLASSYFAAAGVFAAAITPDYAHIVTDARRKTPIAYYIGDHDQYFTLAQTRATRDLLEQNGFPLHYVELANHDHDYAAVSAQVNPDMWSYLRSQSLP